MGKQQLIQMLVRWSGALAGWVCSAALVGCGNSPDGTPVVLPEGSPGIGFDDLRYSPSLHRVLAPAGRSENLALVDPD